MQSYKTTAAIHSTRQVQKSVEWNGRRKQGWRDNRGGSRAVERNSDGNGGYRTNQQRSNTNQRRSNAEQCGAAMAMGHTIRINGSATDAGSRDISRGFVRIDK